MIKRSLKQIFYKFLGTSETPIVLSNMYHLTMRDMFALKSALPHTLNFMDTRFWLPEKAKIIGSMTDWAFNDKFKDFVKRQDNPFLIRFQHGGEGFEVPGPKYLPSWHWWKKPLAASQEMAVDRVYTWGWGEYKLPSPHLSRLIDTHLPKLNKLFLMGTIRHLNTQGQLVAYFRNKCYFIDYLPKDIRDSILYRPYPYDYGWENHADITFLSPKIVFVERGRAVDWMQKAKMVVIDHPHTGFLEALTINVPSVFFWSNTTYKMKEEAKPYFDLLREAGIVFDNPWDAARKVKNVFYNCKEWWESKKIQEVRKKFCNQFALADKNWRQVWIKEFKRLHNGIGFSGEKYEKP